MLRKIIKPSKKKYRQNYYFSTKKFLISKKITDQHFFYAPSKIRICDHIFFIKISIGKIIKNIYKIYH